MQGALLLTQRSQGWRCSREVSCPAYYPRDHGSGFMEGLRVPESVALVVLALPSMQGISGAHPWHSLAPIHISKGFFLRTTVRLQAATHRARLFFKPMVCTVCLDSWKTSLRLSWLWAVGQRQLSDSATAIIIVYKNTTIIKACRENLEKATCLPSAYSRDTPS